ncbi:gibberellin 2-beta-dioxygenase 1-like isoform X2 [Zingiber officinale]|uniref:gibberellin 2-beta-dioxygenase 1-like isoform X2 n=1 Tax=Zingiber officinale TaxID=94328 RepID=UPI001C4B03A3|nr:gibberellin 2-beta-dioxygenase 1-like isoform X2 [Zingiber officinale]
MVVLTPSPAMKQIPAINLSEPGSEALLVRACEDLGFFKVTEHDIPMELIAKLEEEALKFFALSPEEKELAGRANPFGYGSKNIGGHGDVGWVEYLLMPITSEPLSMAFLMHPSASSFRSALDEYALAVRKLACRVLELMAQGLGMEQRDAFRKLVADEESDSMLRLNHYPPCPMLRELNGFVTGFGEHTDPQIISVLRSNDTAGLEISLRDGSWVSVLPDRESFFINVGDSLQVPELEAPSVGERVEVEGVDDLLRGAAARGEVGAASGGDGGGGAKQVQGVHVVRLQELRFQDVARGQQARPLPPGKRSVGEDEEGR